MKTMSHFFMIAILSVAALAACQKKSSGSDPAPPPPAVACNMNTPPPPGQYCNNGTLAPAAACSPGQITPGFNCVNGYLIPATAMGGISFLNNVQFANSYMNGMINIAGTGAVDPMNAPNPATYAGPITVNGMMNVMNQSLCGAPMGQYSVSGTGTMSMGSINSLTLSIQGPSMMQIMVGSAVLESGYTRLGILYANLTVNGQPCGSITTY